MSFFRIRPAMCGAGLFAVCMAGIPAVSAQTSVSPAHDPRIGSLITSLDQVRRVRETALSPDGARIVWNVSVKGGSDIELAEIGHPEASHRVTACAAGTFGNEYGAVWSRDSRRIAFFSECNDQHKVAIWLADATGQSAPRLLAQLDGYADELAWSPNGKLLGLLYVKGATRPAGALAAMKPPSGVIGVEGLEVQRVADVDAATGQLTEVTPANLHAYEFDWSPDSTKLTYIAAAPPGENNWWVAKLYTQSPGGEPQVVLDPGTVSGSLHGLQIALPRWSPDGQQIAFIGGLMSDQGSTGGDIYTIPAAGGEPKDITPNRNATPSWFKWVDENTLGISEVKSGAAHLFGYDISSQSEVPDYDLTLPDTIGDGSFEMSISVADNNDIALIRSGFSQAPEVWAGQLTDLRQITHYNDGLKPSWGKGESVEWTNEGFSVQGWLLYPANYDPAKKYPLVVYVHGGPSAAELPRWPAAGYGAVPFSALGYFVLMPNPRGSYGEGEKFTQANRKDFGYGDLRDILAGVDAVEKKVPVDDNRVGITGWSYGGFMTMFAVTQTHRFHAAVSGAGLSNWQSYYGENSIDQWMIPFFGASVYDDPAVYAKSSAIDFIKNVKTPTLMVVGDRDGECPMPQSFEFWHALRDLGVTTELVVYPDEGHHFASAEHQRDVLERALGWFEEYMP
jgi:dipeptidyl aminopeptidase/acylaminoacyl peptidase